MAAWIAALSGTPAADTGAPLVGAGETGWGVPTAAGDPGFVGEADPAGVPDADGSEELPVGLQPVAAMAARRMTAAVRGRTAETTAFL
ncbi:hypothetical protein [Actinoallomurus sp. CA-150999]|uniref:hypothetical protein n=1 Tax=Actinoallomurus sp. CA-150999 TaxID=3239887 RepID=UPI003D94E36B